MIEWITDLKGWFGTIVSLMERLNLAIRHSFEWLLTHLYMLVLPIILAVKSVWDFFVTLNNRILAKLAEFDIQSLRSNNDMFASAYDVLSFMNSVFPLEELFIWAVALFIFWGVCLLIRTIKGVKQTVLF